MIVLDAVEKRIEEQVDRALILASADLDERQERSKRLEVRETLPPLLQKAPRLCQATEIAKRASGLNVQLRLVAVGQAVDPEIEHPLVGDDRFRLLARAVQRRAEPSRYQASASSAAARSRSLVSSRCTDSDSVIFDITSVEIFLQSTIPT